MSHEHLASFGYNGLEYVQPTRGPQQGQPVGVFRSIPAADQYAQARSQGYEPSYDFQGIDPRGKELQDILEYLKRLQMMQMMQRPRHGGPINGGMPQRRFELQDMPYHVPTITGRRG